MIKILLLSIFILLPISQAELTNKRESQSLWPLDYNPEDSDQSHYNSRFKSNHSIKKHSQNIIYDATYKHDKFGFRTYPDLSNSNLKKESHLFLSGCSYVYGEGLNDPQTFGYRLKKKLKNINLLNTGLPGSSSQEHIFLWKHRNFKKIIPEEKGIFIYTMIENHINRISDDWTYLRWAYYRRPVYVLKDDVWINIGRLDSTFRYKWFHFLLKNKLEKYWLKLVSHFKPKIRKDAIYKYVHQLSYLKELYLEQYPSGRFVVVDYPIFNNYTKIKEKSYLLKTLTEFGVEVWTSTYDKEIKTKMNKGETITSFQIKGDGHPSEKANDYYYEYIMKQIEK